MILGQAFMIARNDMVLVRRVLLSPLILLIINVVISLALAPFFLAYAEGGVWQSGIGMEQIATLIYLPCVWLGYRLTVSGKRDFILPLQDKRFREWVVKPLVIFRNLIFALYSDLDCIFDRIRSKGSRNRWRRIHQHGFWSVLANSFVSGICTF